MGAIEPGRAKGVRRVEQAKMGREGLLRKRKASKRLKDVSDLIPIDLPLCLDQT